MSRQQQWGFTLIEIMLVLVLLSLSALAVIATLPDTSNELAKSQAQRLYQRLRLLSEDAVLSGQDFGLSVDESKNSYSLLQLQENGWHLAELHKIKAETTLDEGIHLKVKIGGGVWKNEERLFTSDSLFDEDSSLFEPSSFTKKDHVSKAVKAPQILLLSSGELTPVQISFVTDENSDRKKTNLMASDEQNSWRIVIKENGEILLLSPSELFTGESLDKQ